MNSIWNPTGQNQERSLTGGLLDQEQTKSFGRPIELTGGVEAGWVNRSVVVDLLALYSFANRVMTWHYPTCVSIQ